MQSKFRVNLIDSTTKTRRTRKAHTKSRDGCKSCKQRRTKCDENKPACDKCIARNTACAYELTDKSAAACRSNEQTHSATPNLSSSSQSSPVCTASPNTDAYNLSLSVMRDRLHDTLPPAAATMALRSLQHFQAETAFTFSLSKLQAMLSSCVLKAVWQYPFLMHSVLAVANTHLKKLYRPGQNAMNRYSVVAASHWQCALQSHRKEIQRIKDQRMSSADNTDAVLATTLLSVVFTFATDDEVPPDMFAAGDEESLTESLNPLVSIGGFRALCGFLPYMEINPSWKAVLTSSDDEANSFTSNASGISDLPIAFVKLCGLTPGSSPMSSVYHKLLRALTPILLLEPGEENLPKLFAYVGRVWPQAQPLFFAKDPIALLFLSWWLVQLRQLDLWWITTRAKSQCRAIVNYLSSLEKVELLPFLQYPATFGAAHIDWIWHEVTADGRRAHTMSMETWGLASA